MDSVRRVGAMAAVVIASLIGTSPASAVVSSDTLADPDCNSTTHRETLELWDEGPDFAQEPEDWE